MVRGSLTRDIVRVFLCMLRLAVLAVGIVLLVFCERTVRSLEFGLAAAVLLAALLTVLLLRRPTRGP